MKELLAFWITITMLALANQAMADVNGSLKALCLVADGSVEQPLPQAQLHLELVAEGQRLTARLQIQRAVLAVTRVQLVSSLTSLKTVSFAEFKSYCGDSLVVANSMGQGFEYSWTLNDAVATRTVLIAQTLDLAQADTTTIQEFARQVATELKIFDGGITGTSLTTQTTCSGFMGCLTEVFQANAKSPQVPLDLLTKALTPETVKALQAGESLKLSL